MVIHEIEFWLRSTVLGVIILGAAGSIVAIILIKILKALITRWLPRAITQFFIRRFHFGFKYGYVQGYLMESKDPVVAQAYFAYILVLFITFFTTGILLIVLVIYLFLQSPQGLLSYGTYSVLIAGFLLLYLAYNNALKIWFCYDSMIKPIISMAEGDYKDTMKTIKETGELPSSLTESDEITNDDN